MALDAKDYAAGLDDVAQKSRSWSEQLGGQIGFAVKTGAVVAGAAIAGLTAGVVAFAKSGVDAAMTMDAQMSNIAAILGQTKEEIAPLGDLIQSLGLNPNLKVTAEEAAAAIEMLARNGLKMEQILGGAAEATVLLANATGADFSVAANIGTDAMAIFGITAENMMEAVNGITSVTVNSKFSIDDYALALAQAGGVASAAGVPFDEFNATIAAISPLFASGSDAGTSFKTMIQRLIPASNLAAKVMAELGIITEEGANRFFDAEGNLRSMADVAEILRTALGPLSEEQRNQALTTIFGTDAMRAAVGMMGLGSEGFDKLMETMGQTDALESAATRMDNLAGVMEVLEGVVDAAKLQVGTAFLPVLRLLAEGLLGLAEDVGPLVVGFFEGIAATIERLVPVISNVISAVQAGGWQMLFAVFEDGSSYIGAFLGALGMTEEAANTAAASFIGLVNGVIAFLTPIVEAVAQFVSWKDVLIALGIIVAAVVIPAIVSFLAALAPLVLAIVAIIAVVALLRNAWETDFAGIRDFVAGVWAAIQQAWLAFKALFQGDFEGFAARIGQAWNTAWTAVITFLGNLWGMAQPHLVAFWNAAVAWFQGIDWAQLGRAVITFISNALVSFWATAQPVIAGWWESIRGWFDGIDWQQLGRAVVTRIVEALATLAALAVAKLMEFGAAAKEWFDGVDWYKLGYDLVTLIIEGIEFIYVTIPETLNEFWQITLDWFVSQDWLALGEDAVTAVLEGIGTIVARIIQVLGDLWSTISGWFGSQDWGGLGKSVIDGVVAGITGAAGSVISALSGIIQGAIAGAAAAIGAHSPSQQTYDEIGVPIVQGIVQAILDEGGTVQEALAGILDFGGALSQFSGALVGRFTAQVLDPIKAQIGGVTDDINDWNRSLGEQAKTLGGMFGVTGSVEGIRAALPQLELLRAQGKLTADQAAHLDAFLNSQRAQQQLMEQRNQLEAEYAAEQERVLELQRRQQDLQFLQQQLSLLETIREAGLNPAEILGGFTLGLDASLPDLIEAMSAAMQAIIDQANEELQISSPSRVFARIAGNVVDTMAGVFEDVRPLTDAMGTMMDSVIGAAAPVVAPVAAVPAPAAGDSTTNERNITYAYNNYGSAPADPVAWFKHRQRIGEIKT